ncbi:hypothetical protein Tco_0713103, partial [Tanacetum coccineum]
MVMRLMRKVRGEACHLDEQNPRCLEDWENLDFQDLVVDGECFQVKVRCCRGKVLLLMLTNKGWVDGNDSNPGGGFGKPRGGRETRGEGAMRVGVGDSLGDDEERIYDKFMKCEPNNWDNGLRVCGKDMIVKMGQKHGKRHGAFAFVYDFLHSINDHRSEVELSSNGLESLLLERMEALFSEMKRWSNCSFLRGEALFKVRLLDFSFQHLSIFVQQSTIPTTVFTDNIKYLILLGKMLIFSTYGSKRTNYVIIHKTLQRKPFQGYAVTNSKLKHDIRRMITTQSIYWLR